MAGPSRNLINQVQQILSGGPSVSKTITPSSRFDRIGTIYSRVTALIKKQCLNKEEIPVWYCVYQAYPPKYEPKYDRPPYNIEINHIFYPEDKLRAKVYKDVKPWTLAAENLADSKLSPCQVFLKKIQTLKSETGSEKSEDELIEMVKEQDKEVDTMPWEIKDGLPIRKGMGRDS